MKREVWTVLLVVTISILKYGHSRNHDSTSDNEHPDGTTLQGGADQHNGGVDLNEGPKPQPSAWTEWGVWSECELIIADSEKAWRYRTKTCRVSKCTLQPYQVKNCSFVVGSWSLRKGGAERGHCSVVTFVEDVLMLNPDVCGSGYQVTHSICTSESEQEDVFPVCNGQPWKHVKDCYRTCAHDLTMVPISGHVVITAGENLHFEQVIKDLLDVFLLENVDSSLTVEFRYDRPCVVANVIIFVDNVNKANANIVVEFIVNSDQIPCSHKSTLFNDRVTMLCRNQVLSSVIKITFHSFKEYNVTDAYIATFPGMDYTSRGQSEYLISKNVVWSEWNSWGACSQNQTVRYRDCIQPEFGLWNTQYCHGNYFELNTCVDWKEWSEWSTANPCGTTTLTRARECYDYGLKQEVNNSCVGDALERKLFFSGNYCYSLEDNWTEPMCNSSCAPENVTVYRKCSLWNLTATIHSCSEDEEMMVACNKSNCEENWLPWGKWRGCRTRCRLSQPRYRERSCDSVLVPHHCKGPSREDAHNCHLCVVPSTTLQPTTTNEVTTPPANVDCELRDTCKNESFKEGNETWSPWSLWSHCNVSCGSGHKVRYSECRSGDLPCYNNSSRVHQKSSCGVIQCPIEISGKWADWSNWSGCSVSCGSGVQTRERLCSSSPTKKMCSESNVVKEAETMKCYSEFECPGVQVSGEKLSCNQWCNSKRLLCLNNIAPNVPLSDISSIACERIVNTSTLSYAPHYDAETNTCNAQTLFDGYNCKAESLIRVHRICNCLNEDEILMGAWGHWGECSRTCDVGTRSRSRLDSQHEIKYKHVEPCSNKKCSLDGAWSAWGVYGECSVTCGLGVKIRMRTCTNPQPDDGGLQCHGSSTHHQSCGHPHICPIDGGWSAWSKWLGCDRPCLGGWRKRHRVCNNPRPEFNGIMCAGEAEESYHCDVTNCKRVTVNLAMLLTDEPWYSQYEEVTSVPSEHLRRKIEQSIKYLYKKHNKDAKITVRLNNLQDGKDNI